MSKGLGIMTDEELISRCYYHGQPDYIAAADRLKVLGAENELMRKTLKTIAARSADQLQATQALGSLTNIGPALTQQSGKTK
jgi:hypothetical protein